MGGFEYGQKTGRGQPNLRQNSDPLQEREDGADAKRLASRLARGCVPEETLSSRRQRSLNVRRETL